MAIPEGYVQGLVDLASDSESGITLQHLKDERRALFDLIKENRGSEVINSSVNGRTFGFVQNMTIAEGFSALSQAINELSGTRITCTSPDFSCLQR